MVRALLRAGAQIDTIPDSQCQPQEVVLCPTGAPQKILVQTTTGYRHVEDLRRPEINLRSEQGAEFPGRGTWASTHARD